MSQEAQEAGESALEALRQRVFASAFGSFDPKSALDNYDKVFGEAKEIDLDEQDSLPIDEDEVMAMLNQARRLGVLD